MWIQANLNSRFLANLKASYSQHDMSQIYIEREAIDCKVWASNSQANLTHSLYVVVRKISKCVGASPINLF